MPVTGDFAKIAKLKASLQRALKVPQAAAIAFAPELRGFLQAEFSTGTDPFGDAWKPLKAITIRKGRTPPPMTASGAAAAGVAVSAAGTKDRGKLAGYLKYHLNSRPVLPLRGETWPDKWLQAIKAAAAKKMTELVGGKGGV